MGSTEDFLQALDSIEAEIRHCPDVLFFELSLTREVQHSDGWREADLIDKVGRHILRMSETHIGVDWESLSLDIGGPMFPFVWSPAKAEVTNSFPSGYADGLGVGCLRVWYYTDAFKNPIPKKLLDRFPLDGDDPHNDEDGLAAMLHDSDLNRAFNLMRSIKTAWSMAPDSVLQEFGDLSLLLSMNPEDPDYAEEDIELWWPVVLVALAARKSDVVLTAKLQPYVPYDSIFDDLPAGGDHQSRIDEFKPTTWTLSLSVPSLLAATSCAIRAFRRSAEETPKSPVDPSNTSPPSMPKPYWNRLKGELSFNGEVIRTIRRLGNAKNIVRVLDAFQTSDWPDRIDSPLKAGSQQHHATIRSLNEDISLIRFRSDGEGEGFIWQAL